MRRFRALYGTSPLHLLALAVTFALSGYVIAKLAPSASAGKLLLWFLGAIVAHDLVLYPVYTLLDRAAGGRRPGPGINYVRVPALLSGLLLVLSLPLVLRLAPGTYAAATGLEPSPYLARWLAITAGLFLASGLVWVLRARRSVRR
jgi:hypothetical protein